MSRSFLVTEGKWVGVRIRQDLTTQQVDELGTLLPDATPGGRATVSLSDLFAAAHLIGDLDALAPPVEAVLRRLLAALTARIAHLDEGRADEWLDVREDVLAKGHFMPNEVAAYFSRYAGRWDLYDAERPFLQDPRLAHECAAPVAPGRLAMDRPSGNNPMWANSTVQEAPVPDGEAAGWLLAWHGFGPSGMAAVRTHDSAKGKTCKAGAYRSLISYFPHASENLFVSLVLSVPGPESWPTNPGTDYAPWEAEMLPDPQAPAPPRGPVSLLTARTTHAVLLTPDKADHVAGCRITWGATTALPEAVDPYLIERAKGGPLRASASRTSWRDLDALLLKNRPGDKRIGSKVAVRRPAVFDTIANLPPAIQRGLGVRAVAWDQERQDRSSQWYAAATPPVLAHIEESDPNGAAAIAASRDRAEAVAAELGRKLAAAWSGAHPLGQAKQRSGFIDPVLARYWERAEEEFWRSVTDTGHRPAFRRAALDCFDVAAEPLKRTVHGMTTVAKARAELLAPPRAKKKQKTRQQAAPAAA